MSLQDLSEKITLALALQGGEIPQIVPPVVTPSGVFLPLLQTPAPDGYKYVPCTIVITTRRPSEMTIAEKVYQTVDYQWLSVEYDVDENEDSDHGEYDVDENSNDDFDRYFILLGGVFLAPQDWQEPEQDEEKVCLFSDETSHIFALRLPDLSPRSVFQSREM